MKRLAGLFALAVSLFAASASASKSCHEVSDIVGERACSRYGDFWSHERTFPVVIGIGFIHGSISPDDRNYSAHFGKNTPTLYEFQGRTLGSSLAMGGPDLRFHAFATDWLYLGTDFAVLFGGGQTRSFMADGYQVSPASGVGLIDARFAWVTGVRTMIGRSLSLRVEALTGLEVVGLRQNATPANGTTGTASASHADFFLSTRFALDFWTTHWTTFSTWIGTKPLHPNDLDFGLTFSLHGRPHDG